MTNKYVTVVLSPDNINSNSDYFDIYSDWDNYTTPIATNITLNALTARTTPFNMLVPTASTKVLVFDIANNINTYATIGENNLCDTSNIGFDEYQTESIGRIVAGNLTALTQSNISDYRVYWYGPDSTTNLAFTTGKGTRYTYQYQHPLTNNRALFASAGYYRPIIDKVWLSDIEILGENCDFSQTGNTAYSNNPVPALLSCFDDVLVGVSAFTCDNGGSSSNLTQYEHRVNFTSTGNGIVPQPLSATFKLDSTTKYFAWKFSGERIRDQIKLTFNGSAYGNPIVLENWNIGGNGFYPQPTTPSVYPKVADTYLYFNKITCLTGLTVNVGDTIEMQVLPSTASTSTNWDFYFTCVNTPIDCNWCEKYPRRIVLSSVTLNNTSVCEKSFNVRFENNTDCNTSNQNTDLFKYAGLSWSDQTYNIFTKSRLQCSQGIYGNFNSFCATPQPFTITYEKTIGNFRATTNNLAYLNAWYQQYLFLKSTYASSPNISDPTNLEYFSFYYITFPGAQGLTDCGDGTRLYDYRIHVTSVVTTGQTGSDYWINLTMPNVVYKYTPPTAPCTNGSCTETFYRNIINQINESSNNFSNNITITTNRGSRYINNLVGTIWKTFENTTAPTTEYQIYSQMFMHQYSNETYPASGSPLTIIPSLSAVTCSNITNKFTSIYDYTKNSSNTSSMLRYNGHYKIEAVDFDNNLFKIYANRTISGGTISPADWEHVLTFNNGVRTVLNPVYFL